ncbi:MAG: YebC/PmpR family DNA-binding transcriptional regulator [bacterium]|nr:YebC/PmpR family DNA-binding transcriptional regulator [bacterium]
MSGHSKWHNIRLKKGKVDAQRGKIFTKMSKDIYMAVRKGGPEPETNFLLKVAIQRARAVNMPADNIKRVIEKASGGGEAENYDEITYEGYGTHGVAIIVEAATNNRNRTAADVRSIFSKLGGNLGESGCVGWMFDRRGVLQVPAEGVDEEELMMAALEAGAVDVTNEGECFEVLTEPKDLHKVKDGVEAAGYKVDDVNFSQIPKNTVALNVDQAASVMRIIENLEDLDDVQNVYSNGDFPEEIMDEE